MVKENFCDGLGACLGECPEGALSIVEKEAEGYDEEGVIAHIKEKSPELLEKHLKHLKEHAHQLPKYHSHAKINSCPSAQIRHWGKKETGVKREARISSELRQWPIQLHLVPTHAPYFQDTDLLIVADCVPFAYSNFHQDFLKGKALVIGCPKLDDTQLYREKLLNLLKQSKVKSVEVVHMEVPCCFGLQMLAKDVLAELGKKMPLKETVVGIKGEKIG